MTCMAAMAVIVFVALFFFKAGYGYLSASNWGPKISNRTAWVIMEAPAFLFLLYYTIRFALSGTDTGNSSLVLYIMAGLYLLHYFQRSFIFPLMMRGKSTMPIAIMLMGLVFNTLNAYLTPEGFLQICDIGELFRRTHRMDRLRDTDLVPGRSPLCSMDLRQSWSSGKVTYGEVRTGVRR